MRRARQSLISNRRLPSLYPYNGANATRILDANACTRYECTMTMQWNCARSCFFLFAFIFFSILGLADDAGICVCVCVRWRVRRRLGRWIQSSSASHVSLFCGCSRGNASNCMIEFFNRVRTCSMYCVIDRSGGWFISCLIYLKTWWNIWHVSDF